MTTLQDDDKQAHQRDLHERLERLFVDFVDFMVARFKSDHLDELDTKCRLYRRLEYVCQEHAEDLEYFLKHKEQENERTTA
jgi:hypothetical protein